MNTPEAGVDGGDRKERFPYRMEANRGGGSLAEQTGAIADNLKFIEDRR
jgi:hypothetical protein